MSRIKPIVTNLKWEVIVNQLDIIIQKEKLDLTYFSELKKIIELFNFNKNELNKLDLLETYDFHTNFFYYLIQKGIEDEYYEICGKIQKLMGFEKNVHQDYINSIQNEDEKDIQQEKFNYINLNLNKPQK